ncbi:ArsR/SmtB family transcription factor [Microlunatus sp. GCM10028923]|uniref:ArsR/SmtB family transcription factor n=1 Tax=Microlunatus sp. GCM10028923 TaxID=3273400 RepID=UPI003614635F
MDEVFKALADVTRRRLLDGLNARNGQTLRELCDGLELSRQSVSKHLAVLEDAQLVTTTRRGREKLHYLNAAPINAVADRWMTHYDRHRAATLADLKTALENPMGNTEFVYTTYIKTSPERLWQALTEPAFTRRYWGTAFETDWQPGSPMVWIDENGHRTQDPEQIVLEADPPRRLSYTWHTFTPQWAEAAGVSEPDLAALRGERRSKISFELEPAGEQVRLTVIHGDCEPGGLLLQMISGGWPQLLSDLKTLLETGEDR